MPTLDKLLTCDIWAGSDLHISIRFLESWFNTYQRHWATHRCQYPLSAQRRYASSQDIPISFTSCIMLSGKFFLGLPDLGMLCSLTVQDLFRQSNIVHPPDVRESSQSYLVDNIYEFLQCCLLLTSSFRASSLSEMIRYGMVWCTSIYKARLSQMSLMRHVR